jgi:hypothetical protein
LPGADARCAYGELLLEAGEAEAALAVFEEANLSEREARKSIRAAVGLAAAHARRGLDPSAAIAASEAAVKAYNSPLTQKYDLSRAHLLAGALDEALQVSTEVMGPGGRPLKAGDALLSHSVQLTAEVEAACYAEAAWPADAAVRPERTAEKKGLPAGADPASWWLGRARDRLRTLLKKEPSSLLTARARLLLAQLCLEARLHLGLLLAVPLPVARGSKVSGSAERAMEADEVRAIMEAQGIPAAKISDPAEALRAIERKRKDVLASGGGGSEADELARLHEWTLDQVGAARSAGSAGASKPAGASAAAREDPLAALAVEALEHAEGALAAHQDARCAPGALLVKGRALLALERSAEAIGPLSSACALLAADAPWRAVLPTPALNTDELAAAGLSLGLALLEAGRSVEEAGPILARPLARVRASLPPCELAEPGTALAAGVQSALASAIAGAEPSAPPSDSAAQNPRPTHQLLLSSCAGTALDLASCRAAHLLAAAHLQRSELEAACELCALADACFRTLDRALGKLRAGARNPRLRVALSAERARLWLQWACALARLGEEESARDLAAMLVTRLLESELIADAALAARAHALPSDSQHGNGGLDGARQAVDLLVLAARAHTDLQPALASAHERLGSALMVAFDLNPSADASVRSPLHRSIHPAPSSQAEGGGAALASATSAPEWWAVEPAKAVDWEDGASIISEANAAFARAIELEGKPSGVLVSTRPPFLQRMHAARAAVAAAADATGREAGAVDSAAPRGAAPGSGGTAALKTKPVPSAASTATGGKVGVGALGVRRGAPSAPVVKSFSSGAAKPGLGVAATKPASSAAGPRSAASPLPLRSKPTTAAASVAAKPATAAAVKPATAAARPPAAVAKPAAIGDAKPAVKSAPLVPPAPSSRSPSAKPTTAGSADKSKPTTTTAAAASASGPTGAARKPAAAQQPLAKSKRVDAAGAPADAPSGEACRLANSSEPSPLARVDKSPASVQQPVAHVSSGNTAVTPSEPAAPNESASAAPADVIGPTAPELLVAVETARKARLSSEQGEGAANAPSASARLGLVRARRELGEPLAPMRSILEDGLNLGGNKSRDLSLYEELAGLLVRAVQPNEPLTAVDVLCSYPFSASADAPAADGSGGDVPPDLFGENALRLSAVNLLLKEKRFDDERLEGLLVAIGKCLGGVQHVEKQIDLLDGAFKTDVCKRIYCAITGLSEEEQRASFQARGWAEAYSSTAFVSAALGRRKFI